MTRKYFGTDGIRGKANTFPMTAEMALKTAMATACVLKKQQNGGASQNRAVIGKDTRQSCYMLEQAMASGFLSMGMDVVLLGPVPTPAVAFLARSLRADVGVMISASHNPFEDNGIKLFGADGHKLPDETELQIEEKIDNGLSEELADPAHLGQASRFDDASGRYIEYIKRSLPRGQSLEGLKVVVDCANGAAYKVAPMILWELEAEVISIGVQPNGKNINLKCGATDTQALQKAVVEHGADVGIALDGDADRLIMVDEKGQVVDGDQLMALLAVKFKGAGKLSGSALITTVMSNLGLERYVKNHGIDLIRTPVGDRYVVEKMRQGGYNLGGEQSGHIVLSDFGTTGDGLMAAIQVLSLLKQQDGPASEALTLFTPLPQILKNVRYSSGRPMEDERVIEAIRAGEEKLGANGRILVRASGTEPVIRVMAEGDDMDEITAIVDEICAAVRDSAEKAA